MHTPAGLVELESVVHEQLMGQLLIAHTTRVRRHHRALTTAGGGDGALRVAPAVRDGGGNGVVVAQARLLTVGVEAGEHGRTRDLTQLASKAFDLILELEPELGIQGVIGRKKLLRVVEGDEGVLDAASELGLIGDLPGLETAEVLEKHQRKPLRQLGRHPMERALMHHALDDALKCLQERPGRIVERLLERLHRLKHMRRTVGDHVSGQENAHVDVAGRGRQIGRSAVAQHDERMDALQAALGDVDCGPTAEINHEGLKAAEGRRRERRDERRRHKKEFVAYDVPSPLPAGERARLISLTLSIGTPLSGSKKRIPIVLVSERLKVTRHARCKRTAAATSFGMSPSGGAEDAAILCRLESSEEEAEEEAGLRPTREEAEAFREDEGILRSMDAESLFLRFL